MNVSSMDNWWRCITDRSSGLQAVIVRKHVWMNCSELALYPTAFKHRVFLWESEANEAALVADLTLLDP
jgi:hypothetical protein